MGISSSCPFAEYIDLGNSLESILIKSTSYGDEEKLHCGLSVSQAEIQNQKC